MVSFLIIGGYLITNNLSVIDCECNPAGSTTEECNSDGICCCKIAFDGDKCERCKVGFGGDNCDSCRDGFYGDNCLRKTRNFIIILIEYLFANNPFSLWL